MFDGVDGNMEGGRTEPNADIRTMAKVAWQMFVALTDEGFEPDQALGLVRDILVAGVNGA